MRRASKLSIVGTVVLVAVIVATGVILAGADRRSLRDRAAADGVLTTQLIAGNGGATLSALQAIEDAEGRHMVSEATIAAHLVAIAEAAGLKPDQINSRLKAIATPNSPLDEFWITDEKGHAYLRNLDVDFTFNPDPRVQPQANVFWPLLTRQRNVVVQDSQKREIDDKVFRYVGVAGVDHPRIVQVGYEARLNSAEGQREALRALAQRLVTARRVRAVRFLDTKITTLAAVSAPDLAPGDAADLKAAISAGAVPTHWDGDALKVITPMIDGDGKLAGAAIVYLPADRLGSALRRDIVASVVVGACVLAAGVAATYALGRRT